MPHEWSRFIQWGNSLSFHFLLCHPEEGLMLRAEPYLAPRPCAGVCKNTKVDVCLMASDRTTAVRWKHVSPFPRGFLCAVPSSAFSKKCSPPPGRSHSDGCSYSCTPFHAWNGKHQCFILFYNDSLHSHRKIPFQRNAPFGSFVLAYSLISHLPEAFSVLLP